MHQLGMSRVSMRNNIATMVTIGYLVAGRPGDGLRTRLLQIQQKKLHCIHISSVNGLFGAYDSGSWGVGRRLKRITLELNIK